MSRHLTASSITDPDLDDLLAELGRLRAALALHVPVETEGRTVCSACRSEWRCPTVLAAAPPPVIAAQSPRALEGDPEAGPGVIAGQSPSPASAEVIAGQSLPGAR